MAGVGLGSRAAAAAALTLLVAVGCAAPDATEAPAPTPTTSSSPTMTPGDTRTMGAPETTLTPRPRPTKAPVLASNGTPREARLSIPELGLQGLRVRPYRGSPDDARGTEIQDGGIAASPYGPQGGTGVGGIGNYIVTGHRTSSTEPFRRLPGLEEGAEVQLVAGGKRYTYRVTDTRITSFRSKRSLARQSADVPGRIGAEPTRAMITLSTCRTPEDRAEGNTWSDRFGNPENRIDKIGVLVTISPV